ncbi:zinc-binding dehydrogenase [Bacillus sp. FJAT-50079]|uniref:zinc-binding dehydrogenase n=1 Tax=Bacillus sp. FJAT-50079 TaxID=2833577 RepID=UPI001BC925C4|nr:zinc-binding dehydrogenase [Bacillus sp. FJAT-50079]MBS4210296.1 zinc-binding dehydrogenase [Bacillus sp. FJAT-50079]
MYGTMNGIVLEEHGDVEQLLYKEDIPLPKLRNDEIRVQVKYCGLNHLDIWLRKGGTGDRLQLPRISGSDVVGVVTELGEEVDGLSIDDPVVLYPGKGCGQCVACSEGRETLCRHFEVLGYNNDGGYCEYVQIQGKRAVKITDEELESWAGVPIAYVTAWNALVTKGKMTAKDTVVIWGASGGLGYAALSIAQSFGAKVIGIVSSKEKISFLKEKGFEQVKFIVRDENIGKNIRDLTNKEGADLVLDHVGRQTFNESLKMLKRGGRLAFCGVTTGPIAEIDLRLIFGKQITITGSWMGDLHDFHEVVQFLLRTKAFPHIDHVFPLKKVKEAQFALEKGEHIGKIILQIE